LAASLLNFTAIMREQKLNDLLRKETEISRGTHAAKKLLRIENEKLLNISKLDKVLILYEIVSFENYLLKKAKNISESEQDASIYTI
jgi:hypothetical protein